MNSLESLSEKLLCLTQIILGQKIHKGILSMKLTEKHIRRMILQELKGIEYCYDPVTGAANSWYIDDQGRLMSCDYPDPVCFRDGRSFANFNVHTGERCPDPEIYGYEDTRGQDVPPTRIRESTRLRRIIKEESNARKTKMKITRNHLRRIIQEAIDDPMVPMPNMPDLQLGKPQQVPEDVYWNDGEPVSKLIRMLQNMQTENGDIPVKGFKADGADIEGDGYITFTVHEPDEENEEFIDKVTLGIMSN